MLSDKLVEGKKIFNMILGLSIKCIDKLIIEIIKIQK